MQTAISCCLQDGNKMSEQLVAVEFFRLNDLNLNLNLNNTLLRSLKIITQRRGVVSNEGVQCGQGCTRDGRKNTCKWVRGQKQDRELENMMGQLGLEIPETRLAGYGGWQSIPHFHCTNVLGKKLFL